MTEPDPQPRVDPEHPWPALLSFREEEKQYFGGREEEIEALYRRISASRLTLLFGLSGLGKTSLLRAGLFPRLRREYYFPVYIRLRYGRDLPTPVEQIKAEMAAQARAARIEAPEPRADETLWQYFHRPDADFWDERNYPCTPVLAFDQFEELFTKGREVPERANEVIEQLADLSEGTSPALMRDAAERDPSLLRQLFEDRYRLLIGIRSDYLAQLQSISDRVRAVFANRYELRRMSGDAALKSTLTAGGHLLDEEVARRIVRFVAGAKESEGTQAVDGLEVEPALLSLVCSELNATRTRKGEPRITPSMLSGTKDEILSRFYEASFADVAPELRVLIEDKLVTRDGKARNFISEQTARETTGVTEEDLGKLVHRRLLRFEESGSSRRMELTHDLLTAVAAASRSTREHRLQIEEAQQAQAEAEHREAAVRRSLRRSRAAMLVFFVLLAAAVTGPFIAARWTARGAKKIEADFFYQLALQKLSSEEPSSEGLAYLARTIRLDRGNAAARTLLYEQLVTQPWPVPIRTFGPDGHIASAAFSGDGARVAFRVGQTIEMWDVVKGQRIGKLNAGFEPASIEFGRDGWTLMLDSYSSGPANQPVLWNPGMGRPVTFEDVRRLGCAHPQVFDVSANGSELALGCDGRLTIASLRKERPMEILPALGPRRGSGFAPDSRFIVFVYSFFAVVILDRQRPEDATTRHDSQSLTAVDFSRDSKRVVITHRRDNSVEVRDLESWRTIGRAFNNQSPPRSAIFDRTGSVLMTTADDDGIRLWNVEEGRMLFDPLRHPPLRDAGFSPDGVRMFTASDRTARWWNARDGARLGLPVVQPIMLAAHLDPLGNIVSVSTAASVWQLAPPVLPPALAEIVGKEKIDFSDDRTTAVVQDRQNRMAAFDAASGKRRWTAPAGSNILAFDSHAARAMILDADGVLSLVDTRTWKCLWRRTGHASSQTKCSFSGDGSVVILAEDIRHTGKPSRMLLAAATGAALFPPIEGVDQVWINRDGSLMAHRFGTKVTVWDVSRRQLVLKIGVSEGAEVGFSPDARRLAVKSSSALDVWDIRAGTRRTAKLQKGESLVAAALFSPDGRYLAVLYKNGVALCNPQTLDCTEEMLPHPGVFGAEFSSDGRRLVTATHNDVRVWDVATKRPLTLPLPWDGKFTGVSPDGTTLFGTMNGELYRVPLPLIEDADTERLAGLGEAIAGYRVDRLGVTEPVDGIKALVDLERRCRDVRGPTCQVVRWLRTAEEKRTIAPDSSLSVAEYVKRRRIVDDSSEEWWRLKLLFPNDPAMGPQP